MPTARKQPSVNLQKVRASLPMCRSPYFYIGRNNNLTKYAMRAVVCYMEPFSASQFWALVSFVDTVNGVISDSQFVTVSPADTASLESITSEITLAVEAYASSNSITLDDIVFAYAEEKGIPGTPFAAIANGPTDAPNDAVTNYNVVSTLLGTLVGAVNTANAKQNAIANNVNTVSGKLNSLLAELRTAGVIST